MGYERVSLDRVTGLDDPIHQGIDGVYYNPEGTPYASNTRFNSVVLDFCKNSQGEVQLKTSSGKTINFYQVIPLYPEELRFKMDNNAETLLAVFDEKGIEYKVVNINRRSVIE